MFLFNVVKGFDGLSNKLKTDMLKFSIIIWYYQHLLLYSTSYKITIIEKQSRLKQKCLESYKFILFNVYIYPVKITNKQIMLRKLKKK